MATDEVYKYLKIQNRPYSVNDIVSNLHDKFGKTAVQNAVDKLVADNRVFEKVYGKQKIYCIVQDSKHDTEELMRIDKELQAHANEVETKLQDVQREIKEYEDRLSSLKSTISLEEAREEQASLERRVKELACKLDNLMDSSVITEELIKSKKRAQCDLDKYSRAYSKKKRLCTDILNCILENYPGSKENLYEEIGIESKIVQ